MEHMLYRFSIVVIVIHEELDRAQLLTIVTIVCEREGL